MIDLSWYPKEYLSISSLQSFNDCPASFYLHYFGGVKHPDNESMTLGRLFQDALNAKYEGNDVEAAIDKIPKEHRKIAAALIKQANDFDKIVTIDSSHFVDLGFGKKFIFMPDLLTEEAVVENKYTSGYYNGSMVGKQKQGTLYYLGVAKTLGFKPKVIYQIFNRGDATVKLFELKKTQKDVDELIYWIDDTINNMDKCYKSGIWKTGKHTRFNCDLGSACPCK